MVRIVVEENVNTEGWTRWPTEVPSNPYHSVILCDYSSVVINSIGTLMGLK